MTELKRPERYLQPESIKPKLSSITNFYTQKVNEYWNRIKQLNEYADALENEISVLKGTPKVEVLLDNTPKELIVVPRIMADWFENQLKNKESKKFDGNDVFRIIQDVIKVSNGESTWDDYDITDEIVKFADENEELFLNLIVNCSLGNGYTVEKEQLYEVIINGLYLTKLMKCDDSKSHRFIEKDKLVNWQETGYRLTEKQIKMIDERYMAFAVPVDEV